MKASGQKQSHPCKIKRFLEEVFYLFLWKPGIFLIRASFQLSVTAHFAAPVGKTMFIVNVRKKFTIRIASDE